jgi:hypothetical protein
MQIIVEDLTLTFVVARKTVVQDLTHKHDPSRYYQTEVKSIAGILGTQPESSCDAHPGNALISRDRRYYNISAR